MPDRLKKAAVWLGLVADDGYGVDDEPSDEDVTEVVGNDEADSPEPRVGRVATVTDLDTRRAPVAASPVALSQIVAVHPRTYNEARTIGENFRDGIPVIMNLTEMDDADAKRLVDFSAGLIFGLRGGIERITSKVFLLSPPDIQVTAEDKERIAGGFYNQS